MAQTTSGQVLTWPTLKDKTILSEVDLIVPFHGQYEYVGRLIRTLWATTRSTFYNLCLVDDGSPNLDFLDQIQGMKVPSLICARHPERLGLGAALNTGLQATKSPWVVFLNSDVHFGSGAWLTAMGESYRRLRDLGVKMVGARMDKVPNGDHRLLGTKNDPFEDTVLEPGSSWEIIDQDLYLPFVCVLAHRDLFRLLGPVREYPLGWYEDAEFAARMHSHGFRQAIAGGSAFVGHEGGATVRDVIRKDPKTRAVFEGNFDRCCLDIRNLKKTGGPPR